MNSWPVKNLLVFTLSGKGLIVFGLIIALLGSIALVKGLILTNKQIDNLSGTYFDQNPFLKNSLVDNRKWAITGFILLILGFSMQIVGTLML